MWRWRRRGWRKFDVAEHHDKYGGKSGTVAAGSAPCSTACIRPWAAGQISRRICRGVRRHRISSNPYAATATSCLVHLIGACRRRISCFGERLTVPGGLPVVPVMPVELVPLDAPVAPPAPAAPPVAAPPAAPPPAPPPAACAKVDAATLAKRRTAANVPPILRCMMFSCLS